MNRTFFKYSLRAFVLALFISVTASAQNIKVEAKLQDYTIKLGDQTKLFLVVDQQVKDRVVFPTLLDTITGKVQIVSANKADTLVDQKDKNHITITQSFVITSFDPGTHIIKPFEFTTAAGPLKSNELTLLVQTVKVDTTKAIYDIKQPILVTYTFWDWVRDNKLWVILGFVILAAIIGLVYYLRTRPKPEPVITVQKPVIPPHKVAIYKLTELKAKKLWQQEQFKEYHSELTDIIREYLEQRFGIKTYEKTTYEILASLTNREITTEYRGLLEQLLTLADLAKFAKFVPLPNENEVSMDNAVAFVLKTKQEDGPVNNTTTEGGGANGSV